MNDGMKEKKCGCIVFEIGPPVLCETHQHKLERKEKIAEKKAAREVEREEKGLRKIVLDTAVGHGHDLSRFKEYPSFDGKWVAHCHRCGAVGIVYDRTPKYGDQINAAKLFLDCEQSAVVATLGAADRDAIAARFKGDDDDSDGVSGSDAAGISSEL
jgi:hypothetical protein